MPLAAVKAAPEYAYRSSTSVCPADRAANMLSLQFAHPRLFYCFGPRYSLPYRFKGVVYAHSYLGSSNWGLHTGVQGSG